MIGRLYGRVIESEPDGSVILDVHGVGYELVTPIGTMGRAQADADGNVTLKVHTNLREGALELFGFASESERITFRTLIGISKVGPKLAMAVLGFLSVDELAQLVESGQVARLTKVPGVGKKTAERMVLELKGKLAPVALAGAAKRPAAAGQAPDGDQAALVDQATVLAAALVRMGFKQSEAERAVKAMDRLDRPIGELVREALAILSP